MFLIKGALQLLINRRFAQVPERVSTRSFVVLIVGNSKPFHLGAQGTFKKRREKKEKRKQDRVTRRSPTRASRPQREGKK